MPYKFSKRSLDRLEGVHPDLVRVMHRAITISPVDFIVVEGLRTPSRQRELFRKKATTTMRSRHLTGHAVDIAPLIGREVRWDWPLFHQLAKAVKEAAGAESVPIEWGGDWVSFKDGPHWQLPWRAYPE